MSLENAQEGLEVEVSWSWFLWICLVAAYFWHQKGKPEPFSAEAFLRAFSTVGSLVCSEGKCP